MSMLSSGVDRLMLFCKLNDKPKRIDGRSVIVIGGDWNCTIYPSVDSNPGEPHPPSASCLSSVVSENDLIDVWRKLNPDLRQYTWVKATEGRVRSARLDRIYINLIHSNRSIKSTISPVGFLDHHLVMVDFSLLMHSQCTVDTWQSFLSVFH